MAKRITSIIENGLRGVIVDIECHISNGLPAIIIVGFANRAIEEARERLRGAFSNSKLQLPRQRITINLAPGDVPKDGTGFDLAMAAAILLANQSCPTKTDCQIFIGELSLDGSVRPVRGLIGKLLAAQELGYKEFFIPKANLLQAALIPNLSLFPVENLSSLYAHLTGSAPIAKYKPGRLVRQVLAEPAAGYDFQEITGQINAKRALEIAAAGGHNVLLTGPPGSGKSLLARSLPSILPQPSTKEILEITHLHSLANQRFDQIVSRRPFRSPHHTASNVALVGGGASAQPGEVSLSHRGVLLLDELPEFRRSALEALRQPLEDHVISITRSRQSLDYPADFILVATANPCPCGFFGSDKACQCLAYQINRYGQRLSGPILDRIDLFVSVGPVEPQQLLGQDSGQESSATIRQRVSRARQLQSNGLNASASHRQIKQQALLTPEASNLLEQSARHLKLSARGYFKTLRVAQTIAHLGGSQQIDSAHISEAIQYRYEMSRVS